MKVSCFGTAFLFFFLVNFSAGQANKTFLDLSYRGIIFIRHADDSENKRASVSDQNDRERKMRCFFRNWHNPLFTATLSIS
jgi:hypothetical protein